MEEGKPSTTEAYQDRIQFHDVESGRPKPTVVEGPPLQRQLTDALSIRSIHTMQSRHIAVQYRTVSVKLDDEEIKENGNLQDAADEIAEELKGFEWHTLTVQDVFDRLKSSPTTGLRYNEYEAHLAQYGKNIPSPPPNRFFHKLMVYCFGGFGSLLLIGGILVMIAWKPLGKPPAPANLALGVILLLVFVIQAGFNAWQDFSSSRVMNSIKTMLPADTLVLRDGQQTRSPTSSLVPGDVVQIRLGDKIPADMRMIQASMDLKFDRSVLTGESKPISATIDSTDPNYLETHCIALQGTHCVGGTGVGVVVDTGDRTVFGRIAKLSSQPRKGMTPLQKEILRLVVIIVGLVAFVVILVVILWAAWLRKAHPGWIDLSLLIVDCVSVAVAFIPEGLPIAVTTCLTITAYQMKKNNILCKSLATVESLGSVSVLCSDKTGTLTRNQMSVTDFSIGRDTFKIPHEEITDGPAPALQNVHFVASLCNAARFDHATAHLPIDQRLVNGDATDSSILRFAEAMKPIKDAYNHWERAFEIPFNSKNKFMVSVFENSDETEEYTLMMKGAPDILFPRCSSILLPEGDEAGFDQSWRDLLQQTQFSWALEGKRVLLLASKRIHKTIFTAKRNTAEFGDQVMAAAQDLQLVALVGIVDPPREEITKVISTLRNAGIRIFMVTGDFKVTAQAIGRACGILTVPSNMVDDFTALDRKYDASEDLKPGWMMNDAIVLEGSELLTLNEPQWNQLARYKEIVFARTTPEQKLRIVKEFRRRGEIVAMTGDGVNDAPSLKEADVGIALASGSDVAIEAADMVLMDSFIGIVGAVQSGRTVFDNLRKTITYLLPAGSFSEFWPIMFNVLFGLPQVLSSFLMIVICCFTDCFAAMTLAYEPPEADVLTRPPRNNKTQHLVDAKLLGHAYFFIGVIECACSMSMAFWYMDRKGLPFSAIWLRYASPDESLYDPAWATQIINEGSSVYFVTLVIIQFFNLLATRTRRLSMFQLPPTKNWRLFPAMVAAIAIVFIFCYIPWFQRLIASTSVAVEHWFLPAAFGIGLFLLDEARKFHVRNFPGRMLSKIAW